MTKQDIIANQLADTMIEQATEFSITYKKAMKIPFFNRLKYLLFRKQAVKSQIKEQKFKIYPPTLAKMEMFSKVVTLLEINERAWKENPTQEVWKCCNEKTDLICRFISIAVIREREKLKDEKYVQKVANFIKDNATAEDFVKIFLIVLQKIDFVNFTNAMLLTRLYKINEPKPEKTEGIA